MVSSLVPSPVRGDRMRQIGPVLYPYPSSWHAYHLAFERPLLGHSLSSSGSLGYLYSQKRHLSLVVQGLSLTELVEEGVLVVTHAGPSASAAAEEVRMMRGALRGVVTVHTGAGARLERADPARCPVRVPAGRLGEATRGRGGKPALRRRLRPLRRRRRRRGGARAAA